MPQWQTPDASLLLFFRRLSSLGIFPFVICEKEAILFNESFFLNINYKHMLLRLGSLSSLIDTGPIEKKMLKFFFSFYLFFFMTTENSCLM